MLSFKKQKGFTLVELIISLISLFVGCIVLFLLGTAVYAIGKFLFGWW